jgi:adenine phosphoribosyltransferase
MSTDVVSRLSAAIRDVRDFPKLGIVFKDITPILSDAELFRLTVELFVERCRPLQVSKVVGIDARGFIFGSAVAYALGVGFVPIRKKGKLPYKCSSVAYALEYGEATAEMHADALVAGERVVLVDDLLATGGTAAAAAQLIAQSGAVLVEAQFLIELGFLAGRKLLGETPVRSFIPFG